MKCFSCVFLVVFLVFGVGLCSAQEKQKRDSLYQKIETYSHKRKASKFLYKLIFRNVPDSVVVPTNDQKSENIYQGKYIRNISIETIDPLGTSKNFQEKNKQWFEDFGNRLHVKSKKFAVRGYLLFKKGDVYNAQKLYESERLLRNTSFINRVNISVIDSTSTKDSIDVHVLVLDSWSLKPNFTFSGKKLGVGITEGNFLGLGHELGMVYRTDFSDKRNYRLASYKANNIYGTYINAEIKGEKDFDKNENVYIRADRAFYSPLTRWAGGVNLEYFRRFIEIPNAEDKPPFPKGAVQVQNQDLWGGIQFRVKPKSDGKVTDNIGVTMRFQNFSYLDSPGKDLDPLNFFTSHTMLLGSVSYTQRKFSTRKNVFQFELPEDIAYGKSLSLTGGFVRMLGESMPYYGISGSFGEFNRFGYFNIRTELGTLYKNGDNFRTAFRLDGLYFSKLREGDHLKIRHFFSPTLVIGTARSNTYLDRLNMSALDEFPQYNDNYLGTSKLILRYQLQFFVNKPWKNFYFNPYVMAGFGWLERENKNLFNSGMHTKIGLGVQIYNPFLAFNRFQLSFVFYPKVPFDNNPIFDFNGYRNNHMPIPNFQIGKPSAVDYHYD